MGHHCPDVSPVLGTPSSSPQAGWQYQSSPCLLFFLRVVPPVDRHFKACRKGIFRICLSSTTKQPIVSLQSGRADYLRHECENFINDTHDVNTEVTDCDRGCLPPSFLLRLQPHLALLRLSPGPCPCLWQLSQSAFLFCRMIFSPLVAAHRLSQNFFHHGTRGKALELIRNKS